MELSTEDRHRWWKETGASELRQILLWRWDPIGVSDFFPDTADEYDDYLGGVVELAARGAPAQEIAEHLRTIESEWMGIPGDAGNRHRVALHICGWFEASTDRWCRATTR